MFWVKNQATFSQYRSSSSSNLKGIFAFQVDQQLNHHKTFREMKTSAAHTTMKGE